MEAGTIGKWNLEEGDSFNAGEVIAEIETDKATLGFDAQDPGVIAKILVGAGQEVRRGGVAQKFGCPHLSSQHTTKLTLLGNLVCRIRSPLARLL
jgi:pyruvate dehydrogenase E2 component (dihydrolipoamide acetyltransferase)